MGTGKSGEEHQASGRGCAGYRAGGADAQHHRLDGKDGYYYYKEALKPGEVTAPIFTAVTFKPEMGNEYQNATATVDVSAQAVQTANNGDTVMDAKGWPNS